MESKTLKAQIEPKADVPTTRDGVEEMILAMDIRYPPQPLKDDKPYVPSLPPDLSSSPPAVIMQTLSELSAHLGYLVGQQATNKIHLENVKLGLERVRLKVGEKLSKLNLSEKKKEKMVAQDLEVIRWENNEREAKIRCEAVQGSIDATNHFYKCVSRIISLMELEATSGLRAHNVQRTTSTNILARAKRNFR